MLLKTALLFYTTVIIYRLKYKTFMIII